MAFFRKSGEKTKFYFVDERCIGRECWAPGLYQHRGATLAGSRNTGNDSPMCFVTPITDARTVPRENTAKRAKRQVIRLRLT